MLVMIGKRDGVDLERNLGMTGSPHDRGLGNLGVKLRAN